MMRENLLAETLSAIEVERGKKFDRSFDLAKRLVEQWGEEGLTDRLYSAIPLECTWETVADLFEILAWTVIENGINDNGSAMTRTIERWLKVNDDPRKIKIALNLAVCPFLDRREMENVLGTVAKRHPEFAERCDTLIRTRRELRE